MYDTNSQLLTGGRVATTSFNILSGKAEYQKKKTSVINITNNGNQEL